MVGTFIWFVNLIKEFFVNSFIRERLTISDNNQVNIMLDSNDNDSCSSPLVVVQAETFFPAQCFRYFSPQKYLTL